MAGKTDTTTKRIDALEAEIADIKQQLGSKLGVTFDEPASEEGGEEE